MPQAVTHILVALIIGNVIRDFVVKDKKKFPLHYVLILGLAAILPDLDIAVYWILHWFGFTLSEIHRTFTHNLFVPALFFIASGLTWKLKNKKFGKHHLKIHTILWIIGLGTLIHFGLDALLIGRFMPFYPLTNFQISLDLVNSLPGPLNSLFLPSLDAALLILWLVYLEAKHKISDFI